MKYLLLILLAFALLPITTTAQLNRILNRAANKVQQRADNKVDQAIDKTLDEVEGKNSSAKKNEDNESATTHSTSAGAKSQEEPITSFSKYDFVPGETIVYSEDFSQDEIGELPVGWNTTGKGEAVTLNQLPGKWLRMYENVVYFTANKDSFSKNFTIQFDLVLKLKSNGWMWPSIGFGFLSSGKESTTSNALLKDEGKYASTEIKIDLGENGRTSATLTSYFQRTHEFTSDIQSLASIEKAYGKIIHVAIQVQDRRIRAWFNGDKKFDLPMAVPTGHPYNQVFFQVGSSNYDDDALGFFINNLKVAKGKPDLRHKFLETGKFSTTGILFDYQSAVIKAESYGVVKEMGTVLKDNPSVKVKIVGHTSSDGDDAANMELSKQRSASVKALLVKEFGIEAERILTEGMGETQPIADNQTKEGKTQNRRVEFIKL